MRMRPSGNLMAVPASFSLPPSRRARPQTVKAASPAICDSLSDSAGGEAFTLSSFASILHVLALDFLLVAHCWKCSLLVGSLSTVMEVSGTEQVPEAPEAG